MANLVKIQNVLNEPNINLFSKFAMFDDTSVVWNIASGTATAVNESGEQINGTACLRITPTSKTTINSGGSQMQITIEKDGNYLFSLRHKCYCATTNTQEVKIKVYVNGLLTDYSFVASTDTNNKYQTYCQVIPLLQYDIVDFAFEFEVATEVGVFKHHFDCLKFEFDNYGLYVPTEFSSPEDIVLETIVTIDVPSIASNSFETVTTALIGATIGDYVSLVYPAEIITLGLIVGYPIVTNTDEVSVLIHNHSGGAINPASGEYKFKIVK